MAKRRVRIMCVAILAENSELRYIGREVGDSVVHSKSGWPRQGPIHHVGLMVVCGNLSDRDPDFGELGVCRR